MKIAIIGTRGIPARYGGFEQFAEQLSTRLATRGHEVTGYCRRPFTKPDDVVVPGVRRVILPTIATKHLDTPFHTFLSVLHVLFTDIDVVLICNVANGPLAWIPRLARKPTVLNVDGLDRRRRKWNSFARSVLYFCELMATVTPTRVVTDAKLIQEYYWLRYHKRSVMIAYGAEVPPNSDNLEEFDLPKNKFILYVSRLEPENNPELVIQAYRQIQTDWPLVIVGGNPYDPSYVQRLKSLADSRVVFTGARYGKQYWELLKNAGVYVFACEIGGVHPALIEAMAARKAILYISTPENLETAADCCIPFQRDAPELAANMSRLIGDGRLRGELGQKAQQRAEKMFGWEETIRKYETLFSELVGSSGVTLSPKLD
jgi:glycosyltransferase involved in cell wall biosynthesis